MSCIKILAERRVDGNETKVRAMSAKRTAKRKTQEAPARAAKATKVAKEKVDVIFTCLFLRALLFA